MRRGSRSEVSEPSAVFTGLLLTSTRAVVGDVEMSLVAIHVLARWVQLILEYQSRMPGRKPAGVVNQPVGVLASRPGPQETRKNELSIGESCSTRILQHVNQAGEFVNASVSNGHPAYRCCCMRHHRKANIATVYRQAKLFGVGLFWVACTTNTGWKRWQHDARMELLRSTAEYKNLTWAQLGEEVTRFNDRFYSYPRIFDACYNSPGTLTTREHFLSCLLQT